MERPPPAQRYRFGEYVLEPRQARLTRSGTVLDVQPKVIELLETFVARPGHLFTRADLMRALWPDVHVSDHSLSQVLHKTRQALGDDTGEAGWIQTVHRKGYRFVGAVAAVAEPPQLEVPARDRFVGRQADLGALDRAWDEGASGVLLVGPGGAGKTRLAREHLARRVAPWTCLVDLTGVREPHALVGAMATTLGVPLQGGDAARAVEQIGLALEHRDEGLVLLDNLEGVLPGALPFLDRWRALAPRSRWLLTSRTRAEIDGVQVHEVPPLDEADGVTLFLDRAGERGITLGAGWTDEIRHVVRRLEGSPLAIELAAARTTLLDPAAIRARLDRQLPLLGTPRGEARPRSLRAAVAWSWELCTPAERVALTHLAVFPAAFTLGQAEQVVAAGSDAPPLLELVEGLVDRFLVADGARSLAPVPGRLRLPPPVREFALDHLDPDDDAWGRFVGAMAARADEAVAVADAWDADRHAELLLDVDNLREAVGRCGDAPRERARIAIGLARLLDPAGRGYEAREILAEVDRADDLDPDDAVEVLYWLATVESSLGIRSALDPRLEEAQRHAEAAGNTHRAARFADRRSEIRFLGGRNEEALAVGNEAVALAEAAGDLRQIARATYRAAVPTLYLGRLELGEALVARGIPAARASADVYILSALLGLRATLAVQSGRVDDGLRDAAEAIDICRKARLGEARESMHRMNAASASQEAGRFAEALEQQVELEGVFARMGLVMRRGYILVNRGHTRLHLGDLDGAEADLLLALKYSQEGSQPRLLGTLNRAALETLRGRHDAAIDLARGFLAECGGAAVLVAVGLTWIAVAEAGRGDLAAGRAAIDEARRLGPVPALVGEALGVAEAFVATREARARGGRADEGPIDRALTAAAHPLAALVARACRAALTS